MRIGFLLLEMEILLSVIVNGLMGFLLIGKVLNCIK